MNNSEKTKSQLLQEIDQLKSEITDLKNFQSKESNNPLTIPRDEARLRELLNNLVAGVVVHAPDTSIIMNNPKATELLGLSEEQMRGKLAIDEAWHFVDKDKNRLSVDEYPINKIIRNKKIIKNLLFGVVQPNNKEIKWLIVNGIPLMNERNEIIEVIINFHNHSEFKNAEDQLRKEKEFTEAALNAQLDTFFLFDINKNKALRWNKEFKKLTGYTDEEIKDLPALQSYYDSNDADKVKNHLKNLTGNETSIIELDLICKDGRRIPTEYLISPINEKNGNSRYFISIGRDITNRKKTDKLLENAIDNAAIGMCLINMDGDFTKVNSKLVEMLGYSEDDILQKNFSEITHPDDLEIGKNALKSMVNSKHGKVNIEKRYISKNGNIIIAKVTSSVLFDTNNKPSFFFSQVQDVTEKKIFEEKLKESAAKWQSTFDAMKNSVSIINLDGKIIQCNKATMDIFDLNKQKLEELTCYNIVHNTDETFEGCPMVKMKQSKKSESMTFHNGKSWLNVHVDPIFDVNNNLTSAVHVISDISDLKNTEDELEKQMHRLQDILEGTNAGTWNWNMKTNSLSLNERWAEIIGYTIKELEPIDIKTWSSSIHPDDLIFTNQMLDRHFTGELDYLDVVFRQQHKNGSWVWVNARGKVIEWDDNGNPLRISGTHLDVSAQKQAQEKLKDNQDHLETIIKSRTSELKERNKQLDDALKVFIGREQTIRDLQKKIRFLRGGTK